MDDADVAGHPPPQPLAEGVVDPEVGAPLSARPSARRFNLRGRSLRQHAARGVLINTAFNVGLSGLGLIKGLVIAAFLSREDYGLWGVLVISLGTLMWLKQVGIGDKYIQQDDEDQEVAFQKAFTLEAGFTLIALVVLASLLPLIAAVYGEPGIVLPGLALLAALPAGVLQVPLWAYYRRMQFFRQRVLQAVDPIVGIIVSIALAVAGAGYWALIGGVLAGAYAGAIAALIFSPYRLRFRYDRGTLRSYFSFSWPLFVMGFGSMVIAQSAMLASEARLGLAGAGALALAAQISQLTDRVDGLITGSMYPAICAVKDRTEVLYESFVKSNRLALMWAVPFGLGLTLFAPDLVAFGLGEKWRPALVLLQVFGVVAAFGHIGFNWDAYFRARGETRPMAVTAFFAAAAFVVAGVPLILLAGLEGLAIGVGIQALVHVAWRAFYLRRLFEGFGFMRHAARAITPTVPAVAAVLAIRLVETSDRTLLRAILEAVLYMGVTAAVTWRLEGGLLREAGRYLSSRQTATSGV